MVVKIDGVENKDFGKDKKLFLKFLKENTSSGKVSAQVEVFKAVEKLVHCILPLKGGSLRFLNLIKGLIKDRPQ